MAAGLLTTSCAGVVGAGAAVVVVGAGVLSMTCYDRVSVTVTDQITGTKLCDAKVTFTEDGSVTEATSCFNAALSTGHYKMRVERTGLLPYEAPVDIDTGRGCKHATQTMWVALDRPNFQKAPQQIGAQPATTAPAPVNGTVLVPVAPAPAAAPSAPPPPAASSAPPPPAATFAPPTAPAPAPTPAPSVAPPPTGTFPAAP